MNRKEFGQLVSALREEHFDEYGNKWTQEKLAEESNLTEALIGNIERGSKVKLEPDVLLSLADALKLTSGERKEFFTAASGVDNVDISKKFNPPEVVLDEILRIMEQMQTPAFLTDCFADLLAINAACLTLYNFDLGAFQDISKYPATRFNVMRIFYSSDFQTQREMMGESWSRFAYHCLMIFRTVSLRHRAHPYFSYVLPELNRHLLFHESWQLVHLRERDHFIDNLYVELNHPRWGFLRCFSASMTAVTTHGDLKLYSFLPLSPATVRGLAELVEQAGNKVYRLAPWPEKPTPPS